MIRIGQKLKIKILELGNYNFPIGNSPFSLNATLSENLFGKAFAN